MHITSLQLSVPLKMPYFNRFSSETVSLCLPLARRRANSFLPSLLFIFDLNPCLFARFLLEG
jgi:hypothetical protein